MNANDQAHRLCDELYNADPILRRLSDGEIDEDQAIELLEEAGWTNRRARAILDESKEWES